MEESVFNKIVDQIKSMTDEEYNKLLEESKEMEKDYMPKKYVTKEEERQNFLKLRSTLLYKQMIDYLVDHSEEDLLRLVTKVIQTEPERREERERVEEEERKKKAKARYEASRAYWAGRYYHYKDQYKK